MDFWEPVFGPRNRPRNADFKVICQIASIECNHSGTSKNQINVPDSSKIEFINSYRIETNQGATE